MCFWMPGIRCDLVSYRRQKQSLRHMEAGRKLTGKHGLTEAPVDENGRAHAGHTAGNRIPYRREERRLVGALVRQKFQRIVHGTHVDRMKINSGGQLTQLAMSLAELSAIDSVRTELVP